MELKKAGFEDTDVCKLSAAFRILKGESFVYDDDILSFSVESMQFISTYPSGLTERMSHQWNNMTKWQVEVDWKESLSPENPRWCKVSHDGRLSFHRMIAADESRGLHTDYGLVFFNAKPVSEELKAMLDAEVGK